MKPNLSIIIPCFNCEETLEEAVASCFTQNLTENGVSFEIVMVNDGSTDGTRSIMEKIVAMHSEAKAFHNEKNSGGGAARNAAVGHVSGDVIFCLDSDDILPPGTLATMYGFMQEKIKEGKRCDGVGVHRSKKFIGTDPNKIDYITTFAYPGEVIPFESLLQKNDVMCSLYSVFMHTREAFNIAGGYPTDHGFDTQGFAWRFLANGLIAYTCPDAEYLHRVQFKTSYYMREYQSGRANYNWFKILAEFLYFFNDATQRRILGFRLTADKNLFDAAVRERQDVFAKDYKSLVAPDSRKSSAVRIEKEDAATRTMYDSYWLGYYFYTQGNIADAEKYRNEAIAKGLSPSYRYDIAMPQTGKAGFLMKRVFRKAKKVSKPYLLSLYLFSQNIRDRIGARHAAVLIFVYLGLIVRKVFKVGFVDVRRNEPSEKIDILIPTISKDHELLGTMVAAIRAHAINPINKVYIVSRPGPELASFCEKNECTLVDERILLGYGKEKISYTVDGVDRSGWIFQQLLKLSGDTFVTMKKYLVVDSDTILIRDHLFMRGSGMEAVTVFLQSSDWHEPYYRTFEKMFGYEAPTRLSLTSHMMLFDVGHLREMKEEIAKRHSKSWDQTYIDMIDHSISSSISDYDTYANWLLYRHPSRTVVAPFYNAALSRSELADLSTLEKRHAHNMKSISFHSWVQ